MDGIDWLIVGAFALVAAYRGIPIAIGAVAVYALIKFGSG